MGKDGRGYDRVPAEFDRLAKAGRASNRPFWEAQRRPSAYRTAGIKDTWLRLIPTFPRPPRLSKTRFMCQCGRVNVVRVNQGSAVSFT
jgi:hypothetical protein